MQAIKKRLLQLSNGREAFEFLKVFETFFNTQSLGSAGLAINVATSPLVKATTAVSAIVGGVLVTKPAGTALTALGGPAVATLFYQIWVFTIDAAGNLYTYPGVQASTLAGVTVPAIPETPVQAVIGSLVLYNGTASAFTPGTTALDTALLVPVYNSTVGPFFPIPPI